MSSNKRKVAPSPKPKRPRSARTNSGSESSLPSRYYSTTTAASSSVALSDTDNDNNITITGHPTESLFHWTESEQSTAVDFSHSDTEAPSDNKKSSSGDYSEESEEERRTPWWKRKRVMIGLGLTAAGVIAIVLGVTLGWAYLSPKSGNNDDDLSSTEGFFVGPYETRSINEQKADKHTNRGRLHRGRSRLNQRGNLNGKQREYLPQKFVNPYRKHRRNKTKVPTLNGKRKQEGRFLGFGNAENKGQFNGNANRYIDDQLNRRKQLRHNNKAQNTDIRNLTNPVATDSTESVEIPEERNRVPTGQLVEKEMMLQDGYKFPFTWPVNMKLYDCPPSGCFTNLTFREIFNKFRQNLINHVG